MILKNYYNSKFAYIVARSKYQNNENNTTKNNVTELSMMSTDGKTLVGLSAYGYGITDALLNYLLKGMYRQTSVQNVCNLVIGSGTTPVSVSDYRIENELFDNISFVSLVTGYSTDGTITHTKTMRNDTGGEITVSEIGLTQGFSNGNSNYSLLIYREVLSDPIVVPAGEVFNVSVSIKIPMG